MDFLNPSQPKIATVVRGKSPVTSMSYHSDGAYLYVASEADSRLKIVDCQRGISDKPALKFESDGIRLVQSTHHDQSILYTGACKDKTQNVGQRHAINYLSLHQNKILRQFRGHSDTVKDISMSPVDDTFLTSSADRTVRLWDLKQAGSLASMDMPRGGNGMLMDPNGCPCAAFDSTGLVFGIAAPLDADAGNLIHLYDARNYSGGAFAAMKVESSSLLTAISNKVSRPDVSSNLSKAKWTSMRFNKSGKQILVTTASGLVIMVDGYNGTVTNVFLTKGETGGIADASMNLSTESSVACFTSDDKTVLCTDEDGMIGCWDAGSGELVKRLQGHVGRVGCLASNPKYAQIASSCTNIALWLW